MASPPKTAPDQASSPVKSQRAPKGAGEAFLRANIGMKSDDCLIWPYGCDSDGYGRIMINYKGTCAHRFMCQLVHGNAPSSAHECAHSCGNVKCVNPSHLRWSTHQENILDKFKHGTAKIGSLQHKAILTEEQVLAICVDPRTNIELAGELGCSVSAISYIRTGRSWSWLTGRYHASQVRMKDAHYQLVRA